jgi:UDPglucose 6-dehydrogenase
MSRDKIIVTKSTVPVGTSDKVRAAAQAALDARGSALKVLIASNPEFLKEGAAVGDFMKPDRIVVGTDSDAVKSVMLDLYAPFNRNSDRMIFMDIRSAELTKYAANAMLATKISFMNEIANLAEILGADIEHVRHGIGSDPRIGYQFIYPGIGYGGSCFPKDVRALSQTGLQHGREMRILDAVEAVNTAQKSRLVELVRGHYATVGDSMSLINCNFRL